MDQGKQQWLIVGIVVMVSVGLGFYLYRQSRMPDEGELNVEVVDDEVRADELIEKMNVEVAEDAQKVTLSDVGGSGAVGMATKETGENGEKVYYLLAALSEPGSGEFYEGYAVGEEGEGKYLGKLREAKGGWLLEYKSDQELSFGETKVVVSREKVDDRRMEEVVLEGRLL